MNGGSAAISAAPTPMGAGRHDLVGAVLHLDCTSGAAGDMFLGAWLDLGISRACIDDALTALRIPTDCLQVSQTVRHGFAASKVNVEVACGLPPELVALAPRTDGLHPHGPGQAYGPGLRVDARPVAHVDAARLGAAHSAHLLGHHARHRHDHPHGPVHVHADPIAQRHGDGAADPAHDGHPHFAYAAIRHYLAVAPLDTGVKRLALAIFDRLAQAEAALHATTVDAVLFHEVGALDAIVDIVGSAAAIAYLKPQAVTCAVVAMGEGAMRCAHGVLPLPAPAALGILTTARAVIIGGGLSRELCTPTGAAILAELVTAWHGVMAGCPLAVGYGAGDADFADRPNVLRITALHPTNALGAGRALASASPDDGNALGHAGVLPLGDGGVLRDDVWELAANLDDMSPQLCSSASSALFMVGAVDVWWTSVQMKKNRMGMVVHVLVPLHLRAAIERVLFAETTTLGVRAVRTQRTVLARVITNVETPWGMVRYKLGFLDDRVIAAAPEFDDCAAHARVAQVAVRTVLADAQARAQALVGTQRSAYA